MRSAAFRRPSCLGWPVPNLDPGGGPARNRPPGTQARKVKGREPDCCPRPLVCPATQKPTETTVPFEGSSLACRRTARVDPGLRPPLLKFVAPRSLVCGRIAGSLGSPLPPRPRIFTRAHAVSLRPPSAPSSDEVSSSLELSASFRVLRPARRPPCLVEPRDPTEQPKSASLGVPFPHRDVSRRRPPLRGDSRPSGHVPSATFLTSSTVFSATCLRGLVSSRCHVQGLPFRGLSLAAEPCRVYPADHALLPLDVAAFDQRPRPRLQGFAPRFECGVGRDGLGLDRSAPLVGFSSSGCSLRATWERLHVPSALDLHRKEPLPADPRRFAVARIGWPGFRLPTRSSFVA
jgi:hypothetical protein